jgi:hypothetical protein
MLDRYRKQTLLQLATRTQAKCRSVSRSKESTTKTNGRCAGKQTFVNESDQVEGFRVLRSRELCLLPYATLL